jgi:hypothetical protein
MSKSCQKVVKKLVIKSCPHRPNTENLKENRTSWHLVQKEETTKNGVASSTE